MTGLCVLGDSGGVVNSLDFCPASLKSLGCFYSRCVLSSQWKAVTVNLRISHCQLIAIGCPKTLFFFFCELAIFWSDKKRRKDIFFSTLHHLSTVVLATAVVLAFVLFRDSRFNFHRYTQREATPTQKSARKCAATSRDFLRERLQSAFTLSNQLRRIAQ